MNQIAPSRGTREASTHALAQRLDLLSWPKLQNLSQDFSSFPKDLLSVIHSNTPYPWVILGHVFNSCFSDKTQEKLGFRKSQKKGLRQVNFSSRPMLVKEGIGPQTILNLPPAVFTTAELGKGIW